MSFKCTHIAIGPRGGKNKCTRPTIGQIEDGQVIHRYCGVHKEELYMTLIQKLEAIIRQHGHHVPKDLMDLIADERADYKSDEAYFKDIEADFDMWWDGLKDLHSD